MTSPSRSLDVSLLFPAASLKLYRLARTRYANLSGVGAAVAPGRWNVPGEEAIYTSLEVGVPVLERLAHTPKDLIPSNLSLMEILITAVWPAVHAAGNTLTVINDPVTGAGFAILPSLRAARSLFPQIPTGTQRPFFALAVPSVIVPAWNVVLYPQAAGFWQHISLSTVEPFHFDPRLFPDQTPLSPPPRS